MKDTYLFYAFNLPNCEIQAIEHCLRYFMSNRFPSDLVNHFCFYLSRVNVECIQSIHPEIMTPFLDWSLTGDKSSTFEDVRILLNPEHDHYRQKAKKQFLDGIKTLKYPHLSSNEIEGASVKCSAILKKLSISDFDAAENSEVLSPFIVWARKPQTVTPDRPKLKALLRQVNPIHIHIETIEKSRVLLNTVPSLTSACNLQAKRTLEEPPYTRAQESGPTLHGTGKVSVVPFGR
jgi:hypothetical protein